MKRIGFIGVGIMGKGMVRNLMKAGHPVDIYARSKEKVEDVIGEGAIFHDSIQGAVADADVVITIVGYPKDVEEVYLDEGNIIESAKSGATLIDMTTTSPVLVEKIAQVAKEKGLFFLDAPVTGGDVGAREGTLTILVGGDENVYHDALPILEAMGKNISYQGTVGCGQHAKLANQIMIAGALSGVCEGLAYAKSKGLDLELVIDSLKNGAAGSKQLELLGKKIVHGDFAPGFYLSHFMKDLNLALVEANKADLSLEVLSQVAAMAEELVVAGNGALGTQSLSKYYVPIDVEEE